VKVSTSAQKALLALSDLEREIKRAKLQLNELQAGVALESLRGELRAASERFLDAQNRYDSMTVEVSRLATDLELVEQRLARDESRLNSMSNPKEVTSVQHEIESLKNRKGLLEDEELALLEQRSAVEAEIAEASAQRKLLTEKVSALETSSGVEMGKVQSKVSTLETQLAQNRAGLPAELIASYDRKSQRSLAVAELNGQVCGACNLSITSAAFNAIAGAPADELPSCPNCEAFLVR
jgi:predicted  nucleic acid-binding Zn-ribbon protein